MIALIGPDLVADESISENHGRDGTWSDQGAPHITKIERKPKGVGIELKNSACGSIGCLLTMEVVKDKFDFHGHSNIDVKGRHHNAGTGWIMRLSRPWWGTGRTVHADSAFASVKTAIEAR